MIYALLISLLIGLVTESAQAAVISRPTWNPGNAVVSTTAVHEVRFTVLSAIPVPGTIQLTFPDDLSLAGVSVSDIGLTHGPSTGAETTESLAASAAAGTWGVSLVSGSQSVTFSTPTDAGASELPGNDLVIIRIGRVTGGLVTNPSSGGVYSVAIGGSYEGAARTAFIAGAGGVTVSATVADSGGSSGGGTGGGAAGASATTPPPEETPTPTSLQISGRGVDSITESSARVRWSTNQVANGYIRYAAGAASTQRVESVVSGLNHEVSLTGLAPGTSYTYFVGAESSVAGSVEEGPFTLTTEPLGAIPNVTGFFATPGDGRVTLQWNAPPSATGGRVRVVAGVGGYPSAASERLVYEGDGTSVIDVGRSNGTRYYYIAYVVTATGRSSGALAEAVPSRASAEPTPEPAPTQPESPTAPRGVTEPSAPSPVPAPTPTQPGIDTRPPQSPSGGTTNQITAPTGELPPVPSGSNDPIGTNAASSSSIAIGLPRPDILWYANNGRVRLGSGSEVTAYAERSVEIRLLPPTGQEIVRGQLVFQGSRYALAPVPGEAFLAVTVVLAKERGRSDGVFQLEWANGSRTDERVRVTSAPLASVVTVRDSEENGVEGVDIVIERREGGAWVMDRQLRSGVSGVFGLEAPVGRYRLTFKKEGFIDLREEALLANGVLTRTFRLKARPKNPLTAIDSENSALTNVAAVAEAAAESVNQVLDVVRTPEVVTTASVAAPVATIALVTTAGTAASAFDLFNVIRLLVTQPLLLLKRRKRKKWGRVYHALSKRGVDLAVVRLVQAETGVVAQTRITDSEGRFAFLVQPGVYRLQVVKTSFVFPSGFLKNEKMDIEDVDLYHGEVIKVLEPTLITPNIPIDPVEKMDAPKDIVHKRRLRRVQSVLSAGSLVVTAAALVISPSWRMATLGGVQVLVYLLFRRLAIPAKPKSWGIVTDNKTGKRLAHTVVRIFDARFNKLLETQITDNKGKYAFFAGKSSYYLLAEKDGYERYTSSTIDTVKTGDGVIDEPIRMTPKAA